MSDDFYVYAYGSASKDDPPGVHRLTETLTRSHPLFNHDNELNSQAVIVVSYNVFAMRHGPSAAAAFLKKNLSNDEKTIQKTKFCELRDATDPEWRPPFDLEGLFDEGMLDEAQNTKGLSST
jgi:hypothetical protein